MTSIANRKTLMNDKTKLIKKNLNEPASETKSWKADVINYGIPIFANSEETLKLPKDYASHLGQFPLIHSHHKIIV